MGNEEKIKLADKNGKSDLIEKLIITDSANTAKFEEALKKAKAEHSMNKDFSKDMSAKYEELIKTGYLNKDGSLNENKALAKGDVKALKSWSNKNPSLILECADNGRKRVFERTNRYDDPGNPYVDKKKLETAEDDRVMGIPYAQAMAGDRVYIVNGKIFTGWALYFSLSSIKSPEDYARNVDLVFNVPYLYSALLLKAQLGLGTGFDVNYGSESKEVAEEKMIRKYLFDRLKINTQKLVKTGFHLHTYGNSYWALRRDKKGIADKITILQPERLKIFLDPMTTKIMFYIYLPPVIGGTTIASYPSDGRVNPNILTGTTLSYPTPIVMHPEDIMHFKINDFTEYPFGFSDVKSCIDPATARLDINILAPILYKKYTKPMIHWTLTSEGLGPKQVTTKKNEMVGMLEDLEPGSDPVTTDRWKPTVIQVSQGKGDMLGLTDDIDTQIFAATGAPESYFKARGSTDRMISEQDKTFISRLKIPQSIVGDEIEEKLIKPRIFYELQKKKEIKDFMGEKDVVENILQDYDSWLAAEPKWTKVEWKEIFKQDETQSIANSIALLNAGIIDQNRAAMKVGETPEAQVAVDDQNKIGIDDPITNKAALPNKPTLENVNEQMQKSGTPNGYNEQDNMQKLRGQLNQNGNFTAANQNKENVKDPSQLGGSRYQQHKTKGEEFEINEKSSNNLKRPKKETADLQVGDEVSFENGEITKV